MAHHFFISMMRATSENPMDACDPPHEMRDRMRHAAHTSRSGEADARNAR